MRRRTLFLMGLGGLAGCAKSRRERLNVWNWSNYVAPETVVQFERETGVEVRYAVYESNEEMLARVLTGNSGWDVVFPSNYFVPPMRELGLLAELDRGRIPNTRHLDGMFARPVWDAELRHSVPFMWGSSGVLYDPAAGPKPERWADLWTERYKGRMTMLDDACEVFGAALLMRGRPFNSGWEADLRMAQGEAMRQKALVRAYQNAEVRDQVVAGEVALAQAWSPTAQQAMDAAPRLKYVFPQEGFALYADCGAVLRESKRKALGQRFLDYMLRPEVSARIVTVTRTATANGAAKRLLGGAVMELETLYPGVATLERGQWFEPSTAAAQRLRDRLWTELKTA